MFAVQILQSFAGNVGVNLRCRKVAVPQQQLNDAQIRAAVQQMRRERVAQAMRRQFFIDSRLLRIAV